MPKRFLQQNGVCLCGRWAVWLVKDMSNTNAYNKDYVVVRDTIEF